MDHLNLDQEAATPRPRRGTTRVFADEDGTLKTVQPDGTVEEVGAGPGGSTPQFVVQDTAVTFADFQAEGDSVPIADVLEGDSVLGVVVWDKPVEFDGDGDYTICEIGQPHDEAHGLGGNQAFPLQATDFTTIGNVRFKSIAGVPGFFPGATAAGARTPWSIDADTTLELVWTYVGSGATPPTTGEATIRTLIARSVA